MSHSIAIAEIEENYYIVFFYFRYRLIMIINHYNWFDEFISDTFTIAFLHRFSKFKEKDLRPITIAIHHSFFLKTQNTIIFGHQQTFAPDWI